MPTAKALALEQKVQDAGSMPAGMVSMPFTVNVPRAEGSSKPKRDVGTEQDTKKGQCTSNACVACGATASKHCAACGTVKYCSRECQTSHWKEHKAACRAAAPREADEWTESNRWAKGLKISDRYEWLCNCYQMRCDDDYTWGGARAATGRKLSPPRMHVRPSTPLTLHTRHAGRPKEGAHEWCVLIFDVSHTPDTHTHR